MLSELKAAKPDLNIEIVGINRFDQAYGNDGLTALCTFPWLQDMANVDAWTLWKANKDDVFIVDGSGCQQGLFPLSQYDLTNPQNRETLKQMLLAAAVVRDTDGDQLPDDWGQQYFGASAVKPGEDPDGDGRDNFTEYAFGTHPKDPRSATPLRVVLRSVGSQRELSIVFHRRAGSVLDYTIEISTDLVHWTPVDATVATVSAPRNLYDGTGTSEVRVALKLVSGDSRQWVRVRAVPRRR